MDIYGFSNSGVNLVNPNISVNYLASTGYTTGAGRKQTPNYASPITFFAQVQKLTQRELKKFEHLTTQGVLHKMLARGTIAGIVRLTSQGGDIIQIGGQTWAILAIVEQWNLWVECIIVQQEAAQ